MKFSHFVEISPKVKNKKNKKYPFIDMKSISPGERFVSSQESKKFKGGGSKFQDKDILFARITPCLENGKIAQYKSNDLTPAFGSTEFFIFRAKENLINSTYLYYLCYSPIIRKTAEKSMVGASGRQRARLESLKDINIELPNLEEQEKIAAILSTYDELIENNNRRIEILEEMDETIYKEWFVHFRFPGHKKVEMVDSELGKIPKGWKIYKICEKFSTILGGTPSRLKAQYWNGKIPWINSGKVNNLRIIDESEFISELGLKRSSTKMMPKRTTVIAITGATLGQVSLLEIEACANQSVVGIFDKEHFYNEYIYLKLCEIIQGIIRKSGGGAQQHINKNIINSEKILLPSIEIINRFNKYIRPIFDLIKTLLIKNKRLKNFRDTLLPKLISGKIDVSDLDIKIEEKK